MIINEKTKIASLLRGHPDALETIVSLSPDFKKLRNPLLRKIMAARTTIAMAAKVGGCTPGDFFTALQPLGFEVGATDEPEEQKTETTPRPEFLQKLNPQQIVTLDVRSIISGGKDPLRQIQQKVNDLQEGQALKIINSFEPVPLISLLGKQGFLAYSETLSEDLVETYFYKTAGAGPIPETEVQADGDWPEIWNRFSGRLEEIDVRHLEMPMPMMTILEALEKLPEDKALYVHHKRIPVFLLTELKEREFDYRIKNEGEGKVFLLIFKNQ